MLLSDADIKTELDTGRLTIVPHELGMIQPASIDVRLGRLFRVFETHRYPVVDPAADQSGTAQLVRVGDDERFVLHPGEFALAATLEEVELPDNLAARLEGKSSLGRLGLLTHATAGFIDPGFHGRITLELSNVARLPILLHPGMKIGQLCFLRLTSPARRPYGSPGLGSKYQGQRGPTPSRSFQDPGWMTPEQAASTVDPGYSTGSP